MLDPTAGKTTNNYSKITRQTNNYQTSPKKENNSKHNTKKTDLETSQNQTSYTYTVHVPV